MLVDSKEQIKSIIQLFLNKPGFNGKRGFTQAWSNVRLKNVLNKETLSNLSNKAISKEIVFETYILPNCEIINNIFYNHIDELITDDFFRHMFRKLVDFASIKQFPVIPINDVNSESHCELVGDRNVILFKTQPIQDLIDLGIQLQEQLIFYFAHELGHCLTHYHYQSSFKTKENPSEEYKLFNETMAWHIANDLLKEHCSSFNSAQFFKQQEYSLKEYQKDRPEQKSRNQIFFETLS